MNKHEILESVTAVAPTASARVRLRPIDARGVAIRDGLLAERQRVNREVTIPLGAEELERAGTLDNMDWAEPVGNIWTNSKAAWVKIDPKLVNFPKGAVDRTPLFDAWDPAQPGLPQP